MANSNFENAILRGTNFTKANLFNANLRGADLTDAILDDTLLEDADLTGAILDNIDLGYSGYFVKNANTKLPAGYLETGRFVELGRGYKEMTAPIIKLSKPDAPMRARDFKQKYPQEFRKLASISGGRDFSLDFLEGLKKDYASEVEWTVTRARYSDVEQRAHPDINYCMLFSVPMKNVAKTPRQRVALSAAREYFRQRSHPLDPSDALLTIGYIRFAADPINKVWLIEEIQSDAGGLAYRNAENCSFHEEAYDSFGIIPKTTRKVLPSLQFYAEHFYKDALAIFMLEAEKAGYTVEIMSYLDKKYMINPPGDETREGKSGPPAYPYSDLPKEMGITGKRQSAVLPDLRGRVSYYTPNPGVPSWRSHNPPREKSLDEQIRELKKTLREKRADYQNRDRYSEHVIQQMLFPLMERHPLEGAAVITSTYSKTLGGQQVTIVAVDNRALLSDFDLNLFDDEERSRLREKIKFYDKRPFAAAVLIAPPRGEPELAAIEYFSKDRQARATVDEVGKRSRARKIDFSDANFAKSFISIAQDVRADRLEGAAARPTASPAAQSLPAAIVRRPAVGAPSAAARELERLSALKIEEALNKLKDETVEIPNLPEIGKKTRRIAGKDYVIELLYIPSQGKDKCAVSIYLDNKVVRSFWFKVDKESADKQVAGAMRMLDGVIASAAGAPEKPGFLNSLNRIMGKYLDGYGSI
jgi:hypothetical protein